MSIYNTKNLFNVLKKNCAKDWHAYTRHKFLSTLANGTLPLKSF